MVLPSRTVVNETATLRMVALDQFQNPVPAPATAVYLVVEEGAALLSENPVKLGNVSTWGCRMVSFTPTQEGVLRVRGTSADGRLFSRSNASKVFATPPTQRLYWGDIHSHSQFSWDGTGTADDHFAYARYAALLDIYSATDHNDHTSMGEAEWQANMRYTEKWNLPGEFVTLLGYEASYSKPYGHHNVYYRGATGEYRHIEEERLEDIWKRGRAGEMLTIPHHTGGFSRPGGGVNHDWGRDDPRFRTTIEIYSSHGHSEEYAPNHPLSMDVSDFTFNGPGDPGNYVQDAWLAGLKLGVIASSDNHAAQPGKEAFGAMAVWAPALTREAVFDAIRNRRTYGTTGSRIYLEFFLNGEPMGGEVTLAPGEPVHVRVEVLGTGPLRWVEVLRADLDRPQAGFTVVYRDWFAGGSAPCNHRIEWSDPSPPPGQGLYYVRTRQRDLVHGRVAEAWSSPVWVQRG